ncbi:hypothetical protein NEOLEDRAFT_1182722 [Neolentinus lepideus HHB14362 ss-1]|uniref:DUF6532 domain-containing protein n=1 Tax=Neolentinus lepideus HHB14362 ss-1 TaxID=1314782 RepID=A0A165NWB6_9AGAM|nr:hypothetical protein NEOLEDRAFT_1182722 [Neolentinus lepideus HHB14362 ss-1]
MASDDEQEEDEGLDNLGPQHLADELQKEAAQWGDPSDKSDVEYTAKRTKTSHRAPLRVPTADALFDDDEDVQEISLRVRKSKSAGKGKCQLAHEAEARILMPFFPTTLMQLQAPQWRDELPRTPMKKQHHESSDKGPAFTIPISPSSLNYRGDYENSKSEDDPEDDNVSAAGPPLGRPVLAQGTDIVFNQNGRVNLGNQSVDVQAVAREAIKAVSVYLGFQDAFPEIGGRTVLSRDCLVSAAQESSRYPEILHRLVHEDGYGKALGRIPDGQISTWRRLAYSIGSNHVIGGYHLTPGCDERVASLLKSQKYIFPGDVEVPGKLRTNEPYKHPTILAIMQALYFSGSGALGVQHTDLFTSSSPTDAAVEVPLSMVALVTTAIHNSLMEWQTGKRQAREFSALNCGDIYRTHVGILEKLKASKPGFFHALMSGLYRDARAATASELQIDSEDSAFTLMDLSEFQ